MQDAFGLDRAGAQQLIGRTGLLRAMPTLKANMEMMVRVCWAWGPWAQAPGRRPLGAGPQVRELESFVSAHGRLLQAPALQRASLRGGSPLSAALSV
jgi:hypothetical protein